LTDRLLRRTVATALELLIGALVGLVLVPRRGQRAGGVQLGDVPSRIALAVVLATAPAVTAAHGNRDVGVLGALLRRVRVGGGVLLVERRLADGLDGGLVAVPRGVLRRGLIGVVGVAGQRRRRRHVGLRDVTAATTAAD